MKATSKKSLTYSITTLSAFALIFAFTAASGGFPVKLNAFLKSLKTHTVSYNDYKPEDRVYLQFDKPFYKPGDDIWFSAYLRDGRMMGKSTKSDVLHVELINPKGNVQKKIKLLVKNGLCAGDFHLDAETAGGIWKVKAYSKWQNNEKVPFLFEKEFQVQKVVLPNLKMKLDFDREAYGAGAEVLVKLDLQTNAKLPLANHAFTYVASLDGEKLVTLNGKTDALGKADLKLRLPADLQSNDGLVNVMINFNGLTESISRSIPIVLNKIELSLLPEGGDLVYGLQSKVAFRALDEFGKPADVAGVIMDEQGAEVGHFKSFHQGMGAFAFNPGKGHAYYAKLTEPAGITERYDLPDPLARGYILNVDRVDGKEMAVVIRSTESEALSLVAQVRGEVFWASEINVSGGEARVGIPISRFPMGVCQLTLFDSKGIERAERLAFVNRDKELNIKIETDKDKYLPREKVKMTVRVTDDRGMPMPANLSLAVVNDQLISFADNKDGNILSKLLLEPDLNAPVEEAKFYFDKSEEKSVAAMDYLMLTSGWRRFTWEEVLRDRLPTLQHQGERAVLAGIVRDGYSGVPVPNATILAPNSNLKVVSDKGGYFMLEGLDIAKDNRLVVSAAKYGNNQQAFLDYNANMQIALYPEFVAPRPLPAMKEMVERRGGGGKGRVARNRPMKLKEVFAAEPLDMRAEVVDEVAVMDDLEDMDFEEMMDVGEEKTPLKDIEQVNLLMDGIEPRDHKADNKQKGEPGNGMLANLEKNENEADHVFGGLVIDNRFKAIMQADSMVQGNQLALYYRARAFAAPVYTGNDAEAPHTGRTDFRETVYWNPSVKVNRTGKAKIEFYCSDEISSFRTVVEGIAQDGSVGHAEQVYFTQLPFSMAARVPVEVATNDHLIVPVVLHNNTNRPITGSLHVMPPAGLKPTHTTGSSITIPAGMAKTLNLEYDVKNMPGEEVFNIAFASQGHTDAFEQKLKIVSAGFPVALSFSGTESVTAFPFGIRDVVPGSVAANFTAFPNVVSDLIKGIESILREPYGCFEQTSTSSYPNAMVMSYMKEQNEIDPVIMKRASDLLAKGYKRLSSFECSENGYEWFGSNPPHEALTAYGLMQFNDYAAVYNGVDKTMVKRTAKWLMSRRDGKGGFKRNAKALDTFGRADGDVTNAYIVYALSEAGYMEVLPEAKAAFAKAIASNDPYQLALVANAMFNLKQRADGQAAILALIKTQAANGSFTGTKGSITRSGGNSLRVETTALAVLAMLNSSRPNGKAIQSGVESIVKARSGAGGFGSTQGTILALKAMVEYSKFAQKTDEAGRVEIYVDGKKVAEKAYAAGQREAVEITGLEAYITTGNHTIEVKYPGVKNPLPYSISVDYHTNLPISSPDCVVRLKTEIGATKVKMGETVRLAAKLTNQTEKGQPMTMAILGLPAGLSAQPWQLKELQEKGVFDFYEIIGNNVVCYYRQMKPGERREINLDLKADIPGIYTAPASSAYLYYTAEDKDWTALPTIEIIN